MMAGNLFDRQDWQKRECIHVSDDWILKGSWVTIVLMALAGLGVVVNSIWCYCRLFFQ